MNCGFFFVFFLQSFSMTLPGNKIHWGF